MAKRSAATALRGIPSEAKAAIARELVGGSLEKYGRVRVFPKGIPNPEQWVVSVLPSSAANARRIIDALIQQPNLRQFEVFPYGIINPEIARIDIGI